MDSCPPEILHTICSLLDPKDVAAIRLVKKDLAAIGAHYLLDRIRFHGSVASINRLTCLSQHAVFGQNVRTLYWEAAQLSHDISMGTVREIMQKKLEMDAEVEPTPPLENASPREQRLYQRNLQKWSSKPKKVSESAVKRHYKMYQEVIDAEEDAEDLLLFGGDALTTAISNLPRLEEIYFDNAPKCQHMLSKRFVKRFEKWEVPPPFEIDSGNTVYQFRWLLAAVAGLKIEKLFVRSLAPSFFETNTLVPASTTTIRDAMTNVKDINIHFRLSEDHEHYGNGGCFGILDKGGLNDMLSSAPSLQKLSITFDENREGLATNLANVLGKQSWGDLRSITISHLTTTEDSFMSCLLRQTRLKELDLGCMRLEKGSWEKVVMRMQKELSLDRLDMSGVLLGDEPGNEEFWDMDSINVIDYDDMDSEWDSDLEDELRTTLGLQIESYILFGDEYSPNPFYAHEWISDFMM